MPLRNIYLMPKECLKSLQPFSRNAILGDFFRPSPDGFSVVFDHLFSRRMKTAKLSPVKIGTVMHTTTTHLSVFMGPKKSSCGPRNSLLCTKQSTQKTPKTHYGAVTTPTDLLRLHGISPSTLRHLPKPSGSGVFKTKTNPRATKPEMATNSILVTTFSKTYQTTTEL